MKNLLNLPLTKNQRRLWISYLQDKENPAYNLKLTYHLQGDLDLDIFTKSLKILFEQQHSVFSVFRQKEGIPYVDIEPFEVKIDYIDFSSDDPQTAKDKIYSFVAADSRKPFDIETGPLFRLYLLKASSDDHYFHSTIHHIVFDGFSRRIFVQELSRIYNSIASDKQDELSGDLSQSYEFVDWEMQNSANQDEEQMIQFWKENLQDCPSELKFPFDYSRKNSSSGYGYRESFEVPENISAKIRKLSQDCTASMFETVLSAVGVLLNKYTGSNDICIGIPVSTRLRNPKLWKIFGYFVNTGVVRIKIDEERGFREVVSFTSKAAKAAVANSNLAFEKIVEIVKPPRIPGINPIFQVSLSWFTNFTVPMELGKIVGERVNVHEGVSPFDMTFLIWEDNGMVKGEIEYSVDLLDHGTVVRMKENFIALLDNLVTDPDKPICELSALSENELKELEKLNNNSVPVPDLLVHNLFEKQVLQIPQRKAVSSRDTCLTYAELDERANKLANLLLSYGVKPGDMVGLSLDRSCEIPVSLLGILKAGCCYVPLDPTLPGERISYMLEDSGARYLITQDSLAAKYLNFGSGSVIYIDRDQSKISGQSSEKPEINISNQSLAYVIYTSGSTGRPKGVKVHHQGVVNMLLSMQKKPGLFTEDRLLAVTTLSFDISVMEMFLPLATGAEIIVARAEDLTNGHAISELLEQFDITVLQATPITWTLLLSSGWAGKKNLRGICGGEAMSPALAKDLLPKVNALWNCYGPTETTVWSTCFQITDASEQILVGKPLDNTSIYIIDKYNKPLPGGCVGEVAIGGMGVTKGYHNKPELTNEKFIDFGKGNIVYKTGDLGRILKDGNIELYGRIDNQIKLRGFRIEAGEVETLLLNMADIREAVVRIQEFGPNDQRMVAFLNIEPGFKMTNEEINKYLGQILPAYMIPSFYERMDGFPRMPNGKINRKALLMEMEDTSHKEKEIPKELTITQKTIMTIFEEVLKKSNISITDNFFDIGGNSLLAISVFSRMEHAFNTRLGLRTFFDGPRIKDLAEVVDFTNYKASRVSQDINTTSRLIKGEI